MKGALRFIESIRILNGSAQLLPYHQQRINRTLGHFGYPPFELPPIEELCPRRLGDGLVKCRLLYGMQGVEQLEFEAYTRRKIQSLQLVKAPESLAYSFKYADRSALETLKGMAAPSDELLILRAGKYLSDCSFANLALLRDGRWYTPSHPLLEGVQRAFLLDNARLIAKQISLEELALYEGIKLINAMLPLEESPFIAIGAVRGF